MSLDGTNLESPNPPAEEAFSSFAEQEAAYNAEERGSAPTAPTSDIGTPSDAEAPPVPPEASAAPSPERPGDEEAEAPGEAPDGVQALERDQAGKFTKKAKPRDNPQARVEQATRRVAEERDRANALQQRVAELEARLSGEDDAAPPVPSGKPTIEQFLDQPDPYASLAEAMAEWKADEKLKAFQVQQAGQELSRIHAARKQQYVQAITEARGQYPDWDDKTAEADAAMAAAGFRGQDGTALWPAPLLDAILFSDRPIEVSRFVSTHPDVAVQLAHEVNGLGVEAVPLVRRFLEAQLSVDAPAVARTGPAARPAYRPPTTPVTPVRTGRAAETNRPPGDDAPFQEHEAYWNQQEREARHRL